MAALQLVTLQSGLAGRYPAQQPSLLPSGEKQQSLLQLGRTVKSGRHGQAKVFAGLQSVEIASRPSKVVQKDWKQLSNQLSQSSPFTIIQQALQIFGSDVAIAFSGAEDVALIEYAHRTGLPFRVFSLETGRLHEETLKLFQDVEKRYNIHIEYMFPDAAEVEAMVRAKGLFSFYVDGHQECCGVRKVRPLKRALKGLRAWITGQRKDQSPGTRANVPIVQIDSSFEGLDGGPGSLVKWNPLANVTSSEVWNFLSTMEVPVNALHAQGFISIGCQPCTRSVLPGQHEREGRWWWEDATAKECGLHKGNISGLDTADAVASDSRNGHHFPDLFTSKNVKALSREEIEETITHPRDKAGFVVLYAPWCPFSQAMDEAFNEVAERLKDSAIMVGKFRADGDQKVFAQEKLELKSFPTILFLPKGTDTVVKYLSEHRDVDSLLAFVKAFQ